jgi:hypothetical protein
MSTICVVAACLSRMLSTYSWNRSPRLWSVLTMLNFASFISCDVTVDLVCMIPVSSFRVSAYDIMLQQIAGVELGAPTSVRADLITGAAARNLYFQNNTDILRFQLLHVARVHSLLLLNGRGPASVMDVLQAELVAAIVPSRVGGLCGVDSISDTSTLVTIIEGAGSWIPDMPDSLALIALIGWFLTLVSCGGVWIYYSCYTTDTPSAEVVVEPQPMPATLEVKPLAPPLAVVPVLSRPTVVIAPLPRPTRVASVLPPVRPVVFPARRGMLPDGDLASKMTLPQPSHSIEFQKKLGSRFVDMRLPSFERR